MQAPAGRLGAGLAAGVLTLCVLFSGGAFGPRFGAGPGPNEARNVLIASAAVLAAGLLGALALFGAVALPRVGRAGVWFLGSFAALAAWALLSLWWSIQADRSWDYANLTLAYVAFAVVGTFAGPRLVAGALAAATGLAVGWGLLGKAIPPLDPLGDFNGRMTGTVGYWNGFALIAAWGFPLGLWVATRSRLAGLLLIYGSTVALLLTFSRGGLVVAAAAVGLWLLLVRERMATLATLAIGALPGVAASLVAFALPGVSKDDQPRHVRVHDAPVYAAAVLVGAAVVIGVWWWLRRHPVTVSRDVVKWLLVAVAAVAVLAIAAAASRSSGPLTIHGGPSRFFHLGSSDRVHWWKDAWHIFRDHPLDGTGAGTFQLARRALGTSSSDALEPHDLPLQFLAELGLVGGLLLAALVVSGGAAVVSAVRRNGLATNALAAVVLAYGLHTLLEFDWDFQALTGPAVLVVGALAASERPEREPARARVAALGVAVAAVAAVLSVTTPWRADRKLDDALAVQDTNFRRSAVAARDAHEINPLSAEALLAWAYAVRRLGDVSAALELYARATRLQPENAITWRYLGQYQLAVGRRQSAVDSLTRAHELDPNDPLAESWLAIARG